MFWRREVLSTSKKLIAIFSSENNYLNGVVREGVRDPPLALFLHIVITFQIQTIPLFCYERKGVRYDLDVPVT